MSKLSIREFTDSVMLMTLVSSRKAERSKVVDRLIATQKDGIDANAKAYEIEIKVNGIEVDFMDFADEVNRQLDEMVMNAAGNLLKEMVTAPIQAVSEAMYDMERHAKDLATSLENQARKAWNMPAAREED